MILSAACLAACSGGETAARLGEITVAIQPEAASVVACGTASFSSYANSGDVSWSVLEAGGGAVQGGAYTAPAAPGVYHVVVTSRSDPRSSARATVTVGDERVHSIEVTPGHATTTLSGPLHFSGVVTTSCGSFPVP